ncbi:MAG: ribonuclease III [Vulcanimicrobiaceae bacterium]
MPGEARRRRLRALVASAGREKLALGALEQAFVHESAVRERKAERSNERLEFLGDAILGAIVARYLCERYPDASEGELALRKSALVSDAALARSAEGLGFDALLVLGAGLAASPSAKRASVRAGAFEAFVAALAQAAGLERATKFVREQHIVPSEALGLALGDPKTALQEWTQGRKLGLPRYRNRGHGPDHERRFASQVEIAGERFGSGEGPSKKLAERAAAQATLALLAERDGQPEAQPAAPPPVCAPRKRAARKSTQARTANEHCP